MTEVNIHQGINAVFMVLLTQSYYNAPKVYLSCTVVDPGEVFESLDLTRHLSSQFPTWAV